MKIPEWARNFGVALLFAGSFLLALNDHIDGKIAQLGLDRKFDHVDANAAAAVRLADDRIEKIREMTNQHEDSISRIYEEVFKKEPPKRNYAYRSLGSGRQPAASPVTKEELESVTPSTNLKIEVMKGVITIRSLTGKPLVFKSKSDTSISLVDEIK